MPNWKPKRTKWTIIIKKKSNPPKEKRKKNNFKIKNEIMSSV